MLYYHHLPTDELDRIQQSSLALINSDGYQQVLDKMFDPSFYFNNIQGLNKFIEQYNINKEKIFAVMLLGMNPGHRKPIHVDDSTTLRGQLAINIPIQGTKDSEMCWYNEVIFDFYNQHRLYGTRLPCFISNNSIPANAVLELDDPYMLRVDIPHDVHHKGNQQRIILSLRLDYIPEIWPGSITTPLTTCENLTSGQRYRFV